VQRNRQATCSGRRAVQSLTRSAQGPYARLPPLTLRCTDAFACPYWAEEVWAMAHEALESCQLQPEHSSELSKG